MTGLYGHTHKADVAATLHALPALGRELVTMVRMLGAVAAAGGG